MIPDDLQALRVELHTVKASWAYAFACAGRCEIPDSSESRALRKRVLDLQARIEELTP